MNDWLLLVYKIPSEPTKLRAAVWRKLKNVGAFYMQNSVCLLPDNKESERYFRQLRKEIEEMGGEAYLFRSHSVGAEEKLLKQINQAKDEEYAEIIDKCEDFLKEIEKEINARHFTYAELEENEEDLEKLKKWYKKLVARDFLNASLQQKAGELIMKCREQLDEFSDLVFGLEDNA
ncbi:ChrB domain-containing protein [Desulforamulus profundi]|uniref:ChrB domain-containing protein n=1 Tax=Desulforamulus profundi TaxID=1383067 RepID=A0A2C6LK84_9FIRM|nr:Chromate resistance protein ChrB [Desulforamulus profundi]PHJ38990.1 ChrB domain-containing protein [Desulforamulus profundi]